MNQKVLIIDDEEHIIYSIKGILALENLDSVQACNGKEGLRIFSEYKPDLIIADYQMPEMTGLELIRSVKSIDPLIPVIIMTAYGDKDINVSFVKEGAFRYLEKPFDIEELRLTVLSGIEHYKKQVKKQEEQAISSVKTEDKEKIIGSSQSLKKTLAISKKIAPTDLSILIEGESGTGKELIANYIHQNSLNNKGPFIKFNGSALPETLIESELFGYEKGAFTGADQTKMGRFELAHNGSIFIDEVSELPLSTQTKLLRVLQEKEFERLGSHKTIKTNARIISATNRNLKTLIAENLFRNDLYHRLSVFPIHLDPLRLRKEDIKDLTEYILKNLSKKFLKDTITCTDTALDLLKKYNWPGNIRELQNVLSRAVILCDETQLKPVHLFLDECNAVPFFKYALENNWNEEKLIREYAKQVYEHTENSMKKTADFLDITFKTLKNRLEINANN